MSELERRLTVELAKRDMEHAERMVKEQSKVVGRELERLRALEAVAAKARSHYLDLADSPPRQSEKVTP